MCSIRRWTGAQDFAVRKLSSMSLTMAANFPIGTAKVSSVFFMNGRAEMSNIPRTARGRSALCSSIGYLTMEAHPAPKGQWTPSSSASEKLASVNSPARMSGGAKKIIAMGWSPQPS